MNNCQLCGAMIIGTSQLCSSCLFKTQKVMEQHYRKAQHYPAKPLKDAELQLPHINTAKPLTRRQMVILSYIKQGLTLESIAKKLCCSRTNIYRHLALLRKKGITLLAHKDRQRVISYQILNNGEVLK